MYRVDKRILEKYADILVNFALWQGKGIKKGDVVVLAVPESAKALLWELQVKVLEAGAHYITRFTPDGDDRRTMGGRLFFEHANEEQLDYFPEKYLKGLIDEADHWISIIGEDDPHALAGIDSAKIMRKQASMKPFMEWRTAKEQQGNFSWTLGLYGTEAMAKEANMSLEDYWDQIIEACYLNLDDPISKWKEVNKEIERVTKVLTDMKIKRLHVESKDTDLWITLGKKRRWLGGRGNNIPSFEVFTSPDSRYTEGKIRFNQPLYLYGTKAKDIYLEFKAGKVTKVEAAEGQEVLENMLKVENANVVGEFSMTDGRMSKITKFMANTLFDENVGGPQGNTHLALGMSYKDTYLGNQKIVSEEEWKDMGFNQSVVHTDIMSTMERTVTAELEDGSTRIIYEKGRFTV